MGFRIVVIKSRVKLETRLGYLVIRGEAEKKIHISEINTLILQSTAVSLTASLLSELVSSDVKVIFCDSHCDPVSELLPYYGTYNTSGRIAEQVNWSESAKDAVWQTIVRRKILMQAEHLSDLGFAEESALLLSYADDALPGDTTNREGHAAKVYFNSIFGKTNYRRTESYENRCLNYGYAVLLSAFNREVVACGYLTQLGIWHHNDCNRFNLSCDLMEPLRVVVDRKMLQLKEGESNFKREMTEILNAQAESAGRKTTLDLAIRNYVRSALAVLRGDGDEIYFPERIRFAYES